MSNAALIEPGSVVSLWRYPVKSMMGEELNTTEVAERGLLGDRAYALVDSSDGKAATENTHGFEIAHLDAIEGCVRILQRWLS